MSLRFRLAQARVIVAYPFHLIGKAWDRRMLRRAERRLAEAMKTAPRAARRRAERIMGKSRARSKRGRRMNIRGRA